MVSETVIVTDVSNDSSMKLGTSMEVSKATQEVNQKEESMDVTETQVEKVNANSEVLSTWADLFKLNLEVMKEIRLSPVDLRSQGRAYGA